MNVIVFDTETCGSLECPFMYDLGYAVVRLEDGAVLKTANFTINEIFNDAEMMSSAYYAEKLPKYHAAIADGQRVVVSLVDAKRALAMDCRRYNVRYLSAHNAAFDYRSTNTTQRYCTCSKYRYFLPYGCILIDTLKMARAVFKGDWKYYIFCFRNDYFTKLGDCRYTAEILYRYISGNNDFVEEHQGLADVMIEKEILLYCLKRGLSLEDGILWK